MNSYISNFFERLGLDQELLSKNFKLDDLNHANITENVIQEITTGQTSETYQTNTNSLKVLTLDKTLMLMQLETPEGIIEGIGLDEITAYIGKNKGIIHNNFCFENNCTTLYASETINKIVETFISKTFSERMNLQNINPNNTYKVMPFPDTYPKIKKQWMRGR